MKKLIVEKEEGIAEVIDRMLEEKDDEITLVFPKGSVLGRSISNFHLLKREADGAGKSVVVESVDDTILAFAKKSDLESNHPLWRGVQGVGGFSDIVPSAPATHEESEEPPAPKRRGKKKSGGVKLTIHAEPEETEAVEEETDESEAEGRLRSEVEETDEKENRFLGIGNFFKRSSASKDTNEDDDADDDESDTSEKSGSRKIFWIGGGIIIALLLIAWVVTYFFGHVAIAIDFQETPWTYQGNFIADKSIAVIEPANNTIPGQLFTTQKNLTQSFPATGSANVSLKAQGTITVYNAYSSAPQELVATTRFVTPDGKLFRLVNTITVPGAQVTNGQIVPSSITAAIIADQPGTAYNLGPVAKLTIPGFANSPKFNAFYGAIVGTTSGGFVGTKAVPTASDITKAKATVTASLQANLASSLTTTYPNNFKILPGATNVAVTKLTVSTTTDSSGNFSVYGEASLQAIGFDEGAFEAFLLSLAQSAQASSTFKTITVTYSAVEANFTKGTLSFSASAQGTLEPIFSVDDFKASIEGDGLGTARQAIAALPELSSGKLSVWPMWLWSVPSNPSRIDITTN